jgi:hypothetical protein
MRATGAHPRVIIVRHTDIGRRKAPRQRDVRYSCRRGAAPLSSVGGRVGYRVGVSWSLASLNAAHAQAPPPRRLPARLVATCVVLGLTFLCGAFFIGQAPGTAAAVEGPAATPAVTAVVGSQAPMATAGDAAAAAGALAGSTSPDPALLGLVGCDDMCADHADHACTAAAAVLPMTLLMLLLGTRRGGFVGLVPQLRANAGRLRAAAAAPWMTPSLARLCVSRT